MSVDVGWLLLFMVCRFAFVVCCSLLSVVGVRCSVWVALCCVLCVACCLGCDVFVCLLVVDRWSLFVVCCMLFKVVCCLVVVVY